MERAGLQSAVLTRVVDVAGRISQVEGVLGHVADALLVLGGARPAHACAQTHASAGSRQPGHCICGLADTGLAQLTQRDQPQPPRSVSGSARKAGGVEAVASESTDAQAIMAAINGVTDWIAFACSH